MYMQHDIVAAEPISGPHFDSPRIDPAQRSAELEAMLAIANLPQAGLEKLGGFSLAPAREDDAYSYFAQIRATRKRSKGGFEFRFAVPARETGKQDLEQTAGRLVEAAKCFARMQRLKPYHDSVRRMVDTTIEPATGGLMPMRVVALGMTPTTSDPNLEITVDVEMLGHDLTLGMTASPIMTTIGSKNG